MQLLHVSIIMCSLVISNIAKYCHGWLGINITGMEEWGKYIVGFHGITLGKKGENTLYSRLSVGTNLLYSYFPGVGYCHMNIVIFRIKHCRPLVHMFKNLY